MVQFELPSRIPPIGHNKKSQLFMELVDRRINLQFLEREGRAIRISQEGFDKGVIKLGNAGLRGRVDGQLKIVGHHGIVGMLGQFPGDNVALFAQAGLLDNLQGPPRVVEQLGKRDMRGEAVTVLGDDQEWLFLDWQLLQQLVQAVRHVLV
jgi:hypothetical protein